MWGGVVYVFIDIVGLIEISDLVEWIGVGCVWDVIVVVDLLVWLVDDFFLYDDVIWVYVCVDFFGCEIILVGFIFVVLE